MLASFLVQNMLQRRFEKYSKVPLTNGMTGAEVARKMMNDNGIYDVKVECIPGMLTDHYNPATKTVNLSEAVYSGRSVAAAVAAHECGHVVQHAVGVRPAQDAYSPCPDCDLLQQYRHVDSPLRRHDGECLSCPSLVGYHTVRSYDAFQFRDLAGGNQCKFTCGKLAGISRNHQL